MLFVDLRHEGDRPLLLEFHPRVTVVAGLGDDGRRRVASLLGGVARGEPPEGRVRVDVRGTTSELTPELLAELGLSGELEVDPVVRATDLPGARVVDDASPPDDDALDAARVRRADLVERLARAEADAADRAEQTSRAPDVEPVPEAQALADRIEDVHRRLAALPPPAQAAPQLIEQARARLEEGRAEVAAAEAAANPRHLGADDITELEAAHDAVMAAEERADKRLAGPGAKRRLAEARQREQEVLTRLGLSSYGDYLLRTSTLMVDSNAPVRLAQANSALADAEAVWEELARDEGDDERLRLTEEAAVVRAQAVALLGGDPDGDPVDALRALRRPVAPTDGDERQDGDDLAPLRDDLARAVAAEEAAVAAHRRAEVASNVDLSGVERVPLEVYCLARVAAQRDVGTVGPFPLVVDAAFDRAGAECRQSALDLLERFSAMVQVVYLSDDAEIVRWAEELGPEVAAVRRPNDAPAPFDQDHDHDQAHTG